MIGLKLELQLVFLKNNGIVLSVECAWHKVDAGRANEFSDKKTVWGMVEVIGRADLADLPLVHYGDSCSQRHGFGLIMGYENHGCAKSCM